LAAFLTVLRREVLGTWRITRGAAPAEAMEILAALDRGEEPTGLEVLRRGNTRVTFLLPGVGVLKILRRIGTRAMLDSLFLPSALTRELDLTRMAAERGIPVPSPVFSAERRCFGVLRGAALLLEIVPHASTLQNAIEGRFPRPGVERDARADVRGVLAELGTILARLHKAGGVHGDPSPDNVLVRNTKPNGLVLIDWAFALFVGENMADGPIGRRILTRHATERYGTGADVVEAARKGQAAAGDRSAPFAELWANDVQRVTNALIQWGTPMREILGYLEAYYRERGPGPGEKRHLIAHMAETFPPVLRRSIRRTMQNAAQGSRKTAAVREKGALLCYHPDFPLDDIRRAFAQGTPTATVGGSAVELRRHGNAMHVWRNTCVTARFKLPVRLHVACRLGPDGSGALLLEHPPGLFEMPDAISSRRLARFARLLHAFGFRFTSCADGTLVEQPVSLGPFTFRQGSGYVLDDAGAVTFAPEAPMEASAGVVATWLRDRAGAATADGFLAETGRPLRFRL